jgi:hypothetical protein
VKTITKAVLTPPEGKKPWTVRLEWTEVRVSEDGTTADERKLRSGDTPRPQFRDAMRGLRRAVADAMMLGIDGENEWLLDTLFVRGVTWRELDSGDEGVILTAVRALDWTETYAVLNTPLAPVGVIPTDDLRKLLADVRREALLYLDGHRAQASLFDSVAGDGMSVTISAGDLATLDGTGAQA